MFKLKDLDYDIYSDVKCAFNHGLKNHKVDFNMPMYQKKKFLETSYCAGAAKRRGNIRISKFWIFVTKRYLQGL